MNVDDTPTAATPTAPLSPTDSGGDLLSPTDNGTDLSPVDSDGDLLSPKDNGTDLSPVAVSYTHLTLPTILRV